MPAHAMNNTHLPAQHAMLVNNARVDQFEGRTGRERENKIQIPGFLHERRRQPIQISPPTNDLLCQRPIFLPAVSNTLPAAAAGQKVKTPAAATALTD